MVKKSYDWEDAELGEHSRRKHKVLREYFFDYLTVRCKLPQRERFRLAIVDGFAGGGQYKCDAPGSPLIFLEVLKHATKEMNIKRAVEGLRAIDIECLLILNDANHKAIELLKTRIAPIQDEIVQTVPKLHLRIEYLNEPFEEAFLNIKCFLGKWRFHNVLFNLDQCGDKGVELRTIKDIMISYPSVEIFYTFMIESLLTYLQKTDAKRLQTRLSHIGLSSDDLQELNKAMNRKDWLGTAERIVFEAFHVCASYVSPFSINNPDGWRYWLIHFAKNYRAREVYNNILHKNNSLQAHFGRSGLNMLSYDPKHEENSLYLFDVSGRESAKNQLLGDIPRLIMESGDMMSVADFYENIYNMTPAHTDEIHSAIIKNDDLEVITPKGGGRRKANTISVGDVIKLKAQRSFFPVFSS